LGSLQLHSPSPITGFKGASQQEGIKGIMGESCRHGKQDPGEKLKGNEKWKEKERERGTGIAP